MSVVCMVLYGNRVVRIVRETEGLVSESMCVYKCARVVHVE